MATIGEMIWQLDAERAAYEASLRADERRAEADRLDRRAARAAAAGAELYADHLERRAGHLRRLARAGE